MRTHFTLLLCCLTLSIQSILGQQDERIQQLAVRLDSIEKTVPNLGKKINFSITQTSVTTLLNAVGKSNEINFSSDSSLNSIMVSHSFTDTSIKDILLFLMRRHSLTFDVTGNIIHIHKYVQPYVPKEIKIQYDEGKNVISLDLNQDSLFVVTKKITDLTKKNFVYQIGLSNKRLSGYLQDAPLEDALKKIADINGLKFSKSEDNYYRFYEPQRKLRKRLLQKNGGNSLYFQVIDSTKQLLEIDVQNTAIKPLIEEIAYDLNINLATSVPVEKIGNTTFKSAEVSFKELLDKLLEDTDYAYSYADNTFRFAPRKNASVRKTVTIPLISRSIEMMMQPMQNSLGNSATMSQPNNFNNFQQNLGNNAFANNQNRNLSQNLNTRTRQPFSEDFNSRGEALLSIIPEEIREELVIKADIEQNSFIVSGDVQRIEKFREFLKEIDKPVPVILIEVMIVEVNTSRAVSTGLDLGIGEVPTTDSGTLLSTNGTDLTLGATSINNIIGGLNGFGSLNLGKVTDNFYARIQALETNGDLKVRSTPKLSTLNGHEASLSNGVRSYFAVRQVNTIGTQNPQNIETVNYFPTDAELSIRIKPMVSGDGNITMSISVLQSSFNSERIAEDAPPGLNSREFSSTIRVKDKDVIILGGLEDSLDSEENRGVPFLARIPVIKWLFSKQVRNKTNSKLSVFIKPTIIQN